MQTIDSDKTDFGDSDIENALEESTSVKNDTTLLQSSQSSNKITHVEQAPDKHLLGDQNGTHVAISSDGESNLETGQITMRVESSKEIASSKDEIDRKRKLQHGAVFFTAFVNIKFSLESMLQFVL